MTDKCISERISCGRYVDKPIFAVWHQSQFAWPVILQWNKKTTMGNMRCVTYSTHAILMTGRYQSCSTTSCKKQNSNFLCIIKAIQWYRRLRHGDLDYRRAMLQPAPPSVRPKILWLSISRTPFYIEPHTCFGARLGVVQNAEPPLQI